MATRGAESNPGELDEFDLFNHLADIAVSLIVRFPSLAAVTHSLQHFFMRPETCAFLSIVTLAFFFAHTAEFWIMVIKRVPCKWSLREYLVDLDNTDAKKTQNPIKNGLEDTFEMKNGNVGVYGLRGRRGKMEDRFDYRDDGEELGLEMYAVYDGHGGDVGTVHELF